MDELLIDLKSVRAGEAPVRAHKRIDVDAFKDLEDGETVEADERVSVEEVSAKYKNIILGLGALTAILVLVIIMLLLMRK
jgi:hypothetical protein